jgi:integrase
MTTLTPLDPTTLLHEAPLAPLLDPRKLSGEAGKAVHAFFHEGQSRNTARTYRTAVHYWGAWHTRCRRIDELLRFRISEGKLFRRILNDWIVEPLDPWAVRDIVRRRAKRANQPLGRLSAHSLRSGFVTEAGEQNISLGETMAMTGHRSVQTVMGYYQSGEISTSRAARLMDNG